MTSQDGLNSAVAALWARQRDEMSRRVDIVEQAVVALLEGDLHEDQRAEAERAAHKIAGAAGSFGFPAASEHAREVELELRGGVSLEHAQQLSDLVVELPHHPPTSGGWSPNGALDPLNSQSTVRRRDRDRRRAPHRADPAHPPG